MSELQRSTTIGIGPGVDLSHLPLVGRADEVDRIVSTLSAPEPQAYVIAGAAGVGKSRLASEASLRMAAAGYPTVRVLATTSAASIPFGAFAPLFGNDLLVSDGMLPFLQGAAEVILERHGGDLPLVLTVDDVHLLDDGSATLVHQLAAHQHYRLLLTLRAGGDCPDPITALWKDEGACRRDLAPMIEEETAEFARVALGGAVDGRAIRWLWSHSAGNPMFARELIIGALDIGDLYRNNGIWVRRRSATSTNAPRLAELIGDRLNGLPAACGEVVDALAVGEPLPIAIIEGLTAADALEESERLGLVVLVEHGRRVDVTLAHPLYAEVRRERMPRARVRRITAKLAESLRATGMKRQDDILRVATWCLDAGERDDAELFAQAASIARARFARTLAASLARVALDAGGGVEAALAVGEAEFFAGNHEAAEKILGEAAERCRDDSEIAAIANARSYNCAVNMNDTDRGLALVEEALSLITDHAGRLRLSLREASIQTYLGHFNAALASVDDALHSDDDSAFHRAAHVASVNLAMLGRTEEALEMVRRGRRSYERAASRTQVDTIMDIGSILANLCRGDLRLAEQEFRHAYSYAIAMGENDSIATFALLGGLTLIEQGRLAEAATLFREGVSVNEDIDDLGALRWAIGGLSVAEGMSGRAGAAASTLERLDALPAHWMVSLEPVLSARGRVWTLAGRGELSAARAMLHAVTAQCEVTGNRLCESVLLHDLVRLGDATAVCSRLEELAGIVDGPAVSLYARHALALASSDVEGLESVAAEFEEMGAALLGAEVANELTGLCQAEGLARRAASWGRKASGLRRAFPEVRTPALVSTAGSSVDRLTRRQAEIAQMAAAGVASKEIAERLFLSVRTVDSHLLRIYTKLGITGRNQLTKALGFED